jgi:hypothetical protein
MPTSKTKYSWRRMNALREMIGEEPYTWKEYISNQPEKRKPGGQKKPYESLSKRRKSFYNFDPDPEKPQKINRPPAVYSNQSIIDKYEL